MLKLNTVLLQLSKQTRIMLLFFICSLTSNIEAQKTINDIATKAGGYEIPIIIQIPENKTGKLPVVFYIHGGGWNGGNATKVPKASLPISASFFGQKLGVIYVGLAYRCKGNKGTFALAIDDIEASIKWFSDRADTFNADMSRIGFAGGSAGTTLSAVMAQKYENCKLYIGSEGMYNIVDLDDELSHFPKAESRADYGLVSDKEKRQASPYYNLRKNPPTALLLHGKDDYLCHYTQSKRYAEKIIESGGKAKVVLYEGINHTCRNRSYPEVLKNSLVEIANLLVEEFEIKDVDLKKIEEAIDAELINEYPSDEIILAKLLGTWKGKKEQFTFNSDGTGDYVFIKRKTNKTLTYTIHSSFFEVVVAGESIKRKFFLRKNENVVYELISENNRWKSRRNNYRRKK
jgi:acetyl esterase/lipase